MHVNYKYTPLPPFQWCEAHIKLWIFSASCHSNDYHITGDNIVYRVDTPPHEWILCPGLGRQRARNVEQTVAGGIRKWVMVCM